MVIELSEVQFGLKSYASFQKILFVIMAVMCIIISVHVIIMIILYFLFH